MADQAGPLRVEGVHTTAQQREFMTSLKMFEPGFVLHNKLEKRFKECQILIGFFYFMPEMIFSHKRLLCTVQELPFFVAGHTRIA